MKETSEEAKLKKSLGFFGNLSITLSAITPASSVFIIVPALLLVSGTGILWSFAAGIIIALAMGFCDAELGSQYPAAGWPYDVVKKVLGNYLGFLVLAAVIVQAVVLTPAIAMGVGTYMHSFFPELNPSLIGCLTMVSAAIIAIFPITANGFITGIFLMAELAVLIVLSCLGFAHLHQPASILFSQPHAMTDGRLSPIGAGALIAGIVTALFAFNGYDTAVNFSEETRGSKRAIGMMILAALGVTVLFEVVPAIAVVLGSPNITKLLSSETPMSYMITAVSGPMVNEMIIIGVILAIYNATIAILLSYGRIIYSSAKEGAWPPAVNRMLSRIHPRWHSPLAATLLVGIIGALLCFASRFILLITFSSVLICAIYGLLAISALVNRIRKTTLNPPYRMPFWPVPPIIVIVGVGLALTQQSSKDLLISFAIFTGASLYYFIYLKNKSSLWRIQKPVSNEPQESANEV
ncbi:amino acid transporter [Scopulibacillus daqui]|uniref:Amino acid transporter n=1 Tax=Scopulibacillus daqui TaxID=1469162 RepID=A0ABS2Q3A0_9BACL|nr:APC family permease [Scopulibacillus daqui]MBM7646771.1 amino acid transporter [Scopulibacillus daqui]